nr:ATP-dependent helicase hrpA [Raoultella sp. NCTC 9187]
MSKKRGNYRVKAWPALVDERDSVAIKLFEQSARAAAGDVARFAAAAVAEHSVAD